MEWDPRSIDSNELHRLRDAAESAWGDDVRHPSYQEHPEKSQGHCYVTSYWLTERLGGYVGTKEGHFFWVSPDKEYIIDLTGDKYASPPEDLSHAGIKHDEDDEGWEPTEDHKNWTPGPMIYTRANHPVYKDFRVQEVDRPPSRAVTFSQRADEAYDNPQHKTADMGWGGDSHPAQEPQAVSDQENFAENPTHWYRHDEPDYQPGSAEYKFVYAQGQMHISPHHSHDELRDHSGIAGDHTGPTAMGYVSVDGGKATWQVTGNISLRGFHKVCKEYTKNAGWKWGGLTDIEGEPVDDDFAPKKSMYLLDNETGKRFSFALRGKTAYVQELDKEQRQAVELLGYKLAEYPGGGNMMDKMRNYSPAGEDYEQFNMSDPSPVQNTTLRDDKQPKGSFKCPRCAQIFPNWSEYMEHKRDEEPMSDELTAEDGQFPELDMDQPLAPHFIDRKPFVFPLASVKEASRFDKGWAINDELMYYGAYLQGEPVGYACVRDHGYGRGEVVKTQNFIGDKKVSRSIISLIQRQFEELTFPDDEFALYSGMINTSGRVWKHAAGQQPKDMIESAVPFLYDVQEDKVVIGHPGERTSDIPGKFTPGGIVEGTYEPGGKVVIRTMTNMPYSTRHLLDLWYWSHPQMEITSVELQDAEGGTTKLANGWDFTKISSTDVGSYIKTLAAADPAVWKAYQALREEGKVYVVGGAVRDALLQKEPKDIDLLVTGVPIHRVSQILEDLPGNTDITGRDFGVYRYRTKGSEVEIALPRTERSTGDKRVDFDVQVDSELPIEDDLLRRDFTVNAMAVNLENGELVDPYEGAKDIDKRRLRTVHPNSFREDPTRLMRALVASSRHGLTPDESTRHEMESNASLLDREAKERVQAELDKLLQSSNPAGAIRLAQETGILKHILPEVAENFDYDQNNPHHSYKLGDHLLNVLENVSQKSTDPDLRLTGLLHDIGKPSSAWQNPQTGKNHYYKGPNGEGNDHHSVGAKLAVNRLRALKFPVSRMKRVEHLIENHMFSAFSSEKGARKFIHKVNDEHAEDLLTLRWADQHGKGQSEEELAARTSTDQMQGLVESVRSTQQPTNQSALAINGNDLIQLGMNPGPEIGRVLRLLTDEVVSAPELNEREVLLQHAQSYIK